MAKRIVAILFALCMAVAAMSQTRTRITEGIDIVRYGTVYVIENDNTGQTVSIKVTQDRTLYNIFCNDTLVRTIAKSGLKAAIHGAILAYSGGTDGGWLSGAIAADATERIYTWTCNQLK